MSMILDAIKRSKEAPEGSGGVPSVDTEHYVAPEESFWQKGWAQIVALTAGVVLLAVLAVVFSVDRDGSVTTQPEGDVRLKGDRNVSNGGDERISVSGAGVDASEQKASTTQGRTGVSSADKDSLKSASISAAKTRPVVIPTNKTPTVTSSPSAEELSSLYAAMNDEVSASRVVATSAATNAAIPEKPLPTDGDDRSSELSEGSLSTDEDTAIDFAEILAQAKKDLGVQSLVESSEPLLETLSQQTKDQIPSLIYSEHKFSASGRSEVVLNGQSLTERQRVGPFTVIEILPDSVILRWRETQFRVRARNSWINL